MQFSKFVHAFDCTESICLLHSLLLKKVYLSSEEWDVVRPLVDRRTDFDIGQERVLKSLYELGFIVNEGEDRDLYAKAQALTKLPMEVSTMFLVVTNQCNFACKYCFEDANRIVANKEWMSPELARSAVDWFARESRSAKRPRWIFFYGGEPLMNFPIVRTVYSRYKELREAGLMEETFFNITTNASLITESIVKEAMEHGTTFGISFDGLREVHNDGRVLMNGKASYDAVMRGLKIVQEAGAEYSCIITVGRHNIESLPKSVEFMITELGVRTIAFNLLLEQPGGRNRMSVPADLAVGQLIKTYEVMRKYGAREGRITKQLSSLIMEQIYRYECDGCGTQVVITPTGEIGPCPAFLPSRQYFEKWDPSTFSMQSPNFSLWKQHCSLTMAGCSSCASLGICGGGCHYNRIMKTGRIDCPDPDFCVYANKVLEWALKDLERNV